jgi:hypothetical protein
MSANAHTGDAGGPSAGGSTTPIAIGIALSADFVILAGLRVLAMLPGVKPQAALQLLDHAESVLARRRTVELFVG